MPMTERELIDDILEAFRLPRSALYNLADYEMDLVYDAYPRYKKEYLKNLLYQAKKKGYNSISKTTKTPDPIYPSRPKEYIIKKKPKKVGDRKVEKIKN